MPSGGRRPGAGRKPRAEKYERPINAAEKQIVDKLPSLVQAQLKLALGQILVKEVDDEGVEDVYAVAPDRRAGQYLIDRILGPTTQRMELSGPDGGPIAFDGLSDTERAARALALLESARTRRAGQAAAGSKPE